MAKVDLFLKTMFSKHYWDKNNTLGVLWVFQFRTIDRLRFGLWWTSQVVDEATVSSIFVSLPMPRWGQVMHMCLSEMGHHWFIQWFVVCSVLNRQLSWWWLIADAIRRNIFLCYLNQRMAFSIQVKWTWTCDLQDDDDLLHCPYILKA